MDVLADDDPPADTTIFAPPLAVAVAESTKVGEKLAPFNPTSSDAIDIALRLLDLVEGDVVFDLGARDTLLYSFRLSFYYCLHVFSLLFTFLLVSLHFSSLLFTYHHFFSHIIPSFRFSFIFSSLFSLLLHLLLLLRHHYHHYHHYHHHPTPSQH